MAARKGRNMVMIKNSTPIAGLRVTGMTFSAEPIDITDRTNDGVRELLAGATSSEAIEITAEGVLKDTILRTIALGGPGTDKLLTDITLGFDGLTSEILSGNFFLSNYAETGSYEGEATFTCTLLSSGDWTYTETP